MDEIVIRAPTAGERSELQRIAELDSAAPPRGRVLMAIVDGCPVAAIEVDSGRPVADPFRPTASAVALLCTRARQMRAGERQGVVRRIRRTGAALTATIAQ